MDMHLNVENVTRVEHDFADGTRVDFDLRIKPASPAQPNLLRVVIGAHITYGYAEEVLVVRGSHVTSYMFVPDFPVPATSKPMSELPLVILDAVQGYTGVLFGA